MISSILAVLFTPIALGVAMFLTFLAEHMGHYKLSAVMSIALVSLVYAVFPTIPLIYLGAYIPLGILWSLVKWSLHCKRSAHLALHKKLMPSRSWVDHSKVSTTSEQRELLKREVDVSNNATKITSWIIAFPVSILDSVLSDGLSAIKYLVRCTLRRLYFVSKSSALKDFDNGSV